jgi:hypothetical protein
MRLVVALTVVVAATRFLAISAAPWEWDEILFASGVRDYDVAVHHPHPPGSPLFIAAAKIFALLGLTDFRALQVVVVIGSMLLFPAVYALGRELGFSRSASIGGALVASFAPNVWYYCGTAFSDVPALVLVLFASVLLLRGSFLQGALLLGVAMGFRPQLILIGAIPFVLCAEANRRRIVPAMALLIGVVAISYAGAAFASSSPRKYMEVVREQQEYVTRVDSYRSPTRPSLVSLIRKFFKPTRAAGFVDKLIPLLALLGAIAGVLRRRRGVVVLLMMFGPIAIFSWLMLDLNAASRYVIAYVPMFALLASIAIEEMTRRGWIAATSCAVIAAVFAIRAWEPLQRVREEIPPVLRAIRSIDHQQTVYATPGALPFAVYYLPRVIDVSDQRAGQDGVLLAEALSSDPCARNFTRERTALEDIARARYFEASVVDLRCDQ